MSLEGPPFPVLLYFSQRSVNPTRFLSYDLYESKRDIVEKPDLFLLECEDDVL